MCRILLIKVSTVLSGGGSTVLQLAVQGKNMKKPGHRNFSVGWSRKKTLLKYLLNRTTISLLE